MADGEERGGGGLCRALLKHGFKRGRGHVVNKIEWTRSIGNRSISRGDKSQDCSDKGADHDERR